MENNLIFIYKEDSNPEDYLKFFNDYYLPIVGGKAFLVYTTLKNMVNKSIEENKLTELLSISKVDFNYAKSVLEGIGLISTFKKDNNFIILLNPVLPPSTFFNKKHLCAALLSSLNNNKDEYQKIVDKYRNKFDLTGYENVSSSFLDIYNIEVANNEKNNYRISLKSNNSDFSFSFSIFLKELKKNSQINAKMIKDKDQEKIEYLANLYEINEEEMARYVTIFFDLLNKDKHIDFDALEKEIIKNSTVSQIKINGIDNNKISKIKTNSDLIKYYQEISPINFLRETLNGKEPSKFEKNIIMMMSNTYHFNSAMIVAVLDYALKKDDNHLYKNNVERYCDNLLRNNANDIYSLLDCLYNEKSIKEIYKEKEDAKKEVERINLFDFNDKINLSPLDKRIKNEDLDSDDDFDI